MLYRFRTLGRTIAIALLVSFAALGASSAVPHQDDCHGCPLALVPHDASQHAVGSPAAPADHPLHCVVCHWTRLHRPPIEAGHQLPPPTERHDCAIAEALAIASVFPAAQPPLRSPPFESRFA